jgi:hypothetical protein
MWRFKKYFKTSIIAKTINGLKVLKISEEVNKALRRSL